MLKLTKRNITFIKFPGWILPPTEAMPLGKSLISLNAQRWYPMDTYIKKPRSLSGRLRRMMRKTKSSLIEIFSLKAVSLRCRSWMSRKIDYLSEEMYNIYKEDLMPNKKKKNKNNNKKKKIKKKKAKAKKKKKR